MEAKNLILAILHKQPNLPTFHLAKLCYLFDLACVQTTGKTCTDLPYSWWTFGPYCAEFEKANAELADAGKLSIKHIVTQKGYDCNLHSALTTRPPRLGETEEELLDFVIARFAKMSTEQLREFVYSTPPMVKAQKKKIRSALDMMERGNAPAGFFDKEVVISLVRSHKTPRSKYVPWEKVLGKLKTLPPQPA